MAFSLFRWLRRVSFKYLLFAVLVLSGVLSVLLAYLSVTLYSHQNSLSLFSKLPSDEGRIVKRQPIHRKRQNLHLLGMKEYDEMKIRRKMRVREVKPMTCAQSHVEPPVLTDMEMTSSWQVLEPGDTDNYVFSAYYESRTDPPAIKIIGITSEKMTEKYCQFWYPKKAIPAVVEAELFELPESHDKRYTAAYYLCFLKPPFKIPHTVSVVKTPCQPPSNLLKITGVEDKRRQYEVNFTVCVTPLNFNFDKADQLVEIVEANRIFGAERFVFYNYSSGARVEKYLESYRRDGIAQIIPWNVPVTVDVWPPDPTVTPEIHYFGQVAALNDCLYRNMFRSRFVIFTDLDELIVPRTHEAWSDMLVTIITDWQSNLFQLSNRTMFPGAYNFQNTFYRLDWEDLQLDEADFGSHDLKLMTLQKLYREEMIYPWYIRSKYIVWSKVVNTVAIHSVYEFIDDSRVSEVRVNKVHALLHHYRLWDSEGDIASMKRIRDNRMLNFSKGLIARTVARHRKVGLIRPGNAI